MKQSSFIGKKMNMLTKNKTLILFFVFPALLIMSCSDTRNNTESKETPFFRRIPSAQSGITFTNIVEENYEKNYFDKFAYVYNGGGVAVGDINNDGLQDIYFTGNEMPNKLYLNEGNLRFKDITESAGVNGGPGWDNGVTMVDINADGWLDIYICKGGFQDTDAERKNLLYINKGDLTFKEEAAVYGLDETGYSLHAAFFDMDNDNDLDAYITSRPDSFYLGLSQMVAGKKNPPEKCRDKLYRNDNGRFAEIGKQAGMGQNYGYALSVLTADLNGDGFQDVYISNDYADADYMYINQGNGTFRDEIKKAMNHLSLFSMGADIADINNDGYEDILVMEMLPEDYKRSKLSMPRMNVEGFWAVVDSGFHKQYMHNMLHLNQGNLFFSEVSQLAGISKSEWSWATLAADFNNDGLRDIFMANGYPRDVFDGDIEQRLGAYMNANRANYSSAEDFFRRGFKGFIELYKPIKVPNYLFKNEGGLQFSNVANRWGLSDSSFTNGAAIADLDNDGDLDLVMNNLYDEAFLYENMTDKKNNYIRIKLIGPQKNPDGIGAKISLFSNGQQQYFEQKTVRGYLSSNEPFIHFGLGAHTKTDSIRVVWPDGRESLVKDVAINNVVSIDYKTAMPVQRPATEISTVFTEVTEEIMSPGFIHKENLFDEYADQILLPHEFAKSGPFIATADVDGDGQEDFYIGGAAGQPGSLYLQKGEKFTHTEIPAFTQDKLYEDMDCTFFDCDNDGDPDLYVVSGGSEFHEGAAQYQDRLYINDGKGNFKKSVLPFTSSSGSCVAVYDFDGDGDLDIFRGSQVMPHAYPYPPKSYILVNNKGSFSDKTAELSPALVKPGMVNSAVWTDLDGDKISELVIIGEWMPIRIFDFVNGKFTEKTSAFGLKNTEGWWNRIVADDIDNDGDMDLVAGNLGENYKFKASLEKPLEVYARDFDNNGTNDIFLAKHLDNIVVPIRGRECTSQQCPMIAQKFPTFLSFAETDLKGILGDDIKTALHYKAFLFSSVMLINDKGKFSLKKLPVEAQLSTVNGMIIKDFNGDGKKDILIAGNKFDVEVETTPADASPGVFLIATGDHQFRSLKPAESGFFAPYNVKDIKLIRTGNGHGILVSANNDKLRIFKTRRQ
jgi:hypothetical protein